MVVRPRACPVGRFRPRALGSGRDVGEMEIM